MKLELLSNKLKQKIN